MTGAGGDGLREARRGQSETLGFVLLVAIAAIGITGIVVLGSAAVADSQHAMEVGSAEHAMTEFDSQVSLVAHGDASVQGAVLPSGSGERVRVMPGAGRMTVTVYNETDGSVERRIMNASLGAVVYENGGTSIAYEGGGVWKRSNDGGVTMVSPPEVHYTSNTLTLPLVTVGGSTGGDSRVFVRQDGPIVANYPNATTGNPLTGGNVVVTVSSDYYLAWGRFFEDRTGGTVSYDHANGTVSIELVVPDSTPSVGAGILSGATAEEIQFQNQGGVDSYNSSAGDYASTRKENTSIVAAGSVLLQNKAIIYGDVTAGGDLTLQNQAKIDGNASYGGALSKSNKAEITGAVTDNATVDAPDAVGYLIDEKLSAFTASNDNGAESAIDNSTGRLTGCGSTCTLESGQYNLSRIQLQGDDHLVLDTSGGPIEVAVGGPAQLQGDAKLEVTGGGTVRFYLDDYVQLQNKANVSVPGERAAGLWFYVRPDASVGFNNQARYVGVVYGPGQGSNPGATIDVNNQVQVYGGLVGSVSAVPNGVGVHFDEALADENPLAHVTGHAPTITYLHVSQTRVNVTAA